jgi:uncharacterized protein (TIGR00299 family) protein
LHAHFDCFSGISGDMILGALVDLGVSLERLQADLAGLPLEGFRLKAKAVTQQGIRAQRVEVEVAPQTHARHFNDISAMIDASQLPPQVKTFAVATFRRLAEAEAAIHGCPIEQVHFHEVGAVDAIVDVVGCGLGLSYLGIAHVSSSPLPMGSGFVDCRHGRLPLPAPATLALLQDIPIRGTELEGELVTPTGAALISTLAERFGGYPEMQIQRIGYGAGRRTYANHPNLLRIVCGRAPAADAAGTAPPAAERIEVIEAAVDDMNPEIFSYLMEMLFAAGALDVIWIPAFMKKNRPGTLVQVLSPLDRVDQLLTVLLEETTTIGARHYRVRRRVLARQAVEIETSLGRVAAKRIIGIKGRERLVPEYESCRRLAREKGLPIREVYDRIVTETADRPPDAHSGENGAAGAGSPPDPDVDKPRAER